MPPHRPRTRRSRASARGEGLKYVAAGIVVLTAVGIIGALAWLYVTAPSPTALDSRTGCPQNGPTAATYVLIDLTDPLPPVSQIQMEDHLQAMAATTAKGALLEVLALDAKDSTGTVRFSRCNPGDGSDESATTGNPEKLKRRYERDFLEPFSAMVKRGLTSRPADQSPILETLQALAVGKISKIRRNEVSVELQIVSDMRQHSEQYSHYGKSLAYERFKNSSAYRNLRTDFVGTDISIFYVQRNSPSINEAEHILFWQEWAKDNGASVKHVERLQGVN